MALDVAAHLTLAVDGDATVFSIMMAVKLGAEVSRGDTQPLAHEVQPAHEQPMARAPLTTCTVQTTHELVLECMSALQVVDDPPWRRCVNGGDDELVNIGASLFCRRWQST
jgi:hypothetical protein